MQPKQMSIWDFAYQAAELRKPIRLIELFGGIGAQAKALERLGADFEPWRLCEWAVPSILAYDAIHNPGAADRPSDGKGIDGIRAFLAERGISADYSSPMAPEAVRRMPEGRARAVYDAIIRERNLVDITRVKADDLGIEPEGKDREHDYVMTYSFPCQDLSNAGQKAGMSEESGTRSSLLWEVIRLIRELKDKGRRPDVLLAENVPDVVNVRNLDDFLKLERILEGLGYKNYWEILNAKDYGVPQNRRRFFMVSVLGDAHYSFPMKKPLEVRLGSFLQDSRDGLFGRLRGYPAPPIEVPERYYITDDHLRRIVAWDANQSPLDDIAERDGAVGTLTTRCGADCSSMKLVDVGAIPIKNATKQGWSEAAPGDGVDIGSRMESHRGTVQKGLAQTLKTSLEVGAVVLSPESGLRIRRLTPLECYRLMGFDDIDAERASGVLSEGLMYHTAGDSIVVDVLEAIFAELIPARNRRRRG